VGEGGGFVTWKASDELGAHLASPVAGVRRECPGTEVFLAGGFAQPEEDHAGFLLRLQADQQHRAVIFKISKADTAPGTSHRVGEKVCLFTRMLPGPEVDVV